MLRLRQARNGSIRDKKVFKRAFSDMEEMEHGGKCMKVRQVSSRASILSGIRQSLSQKKCLKRSEMKKSKNLNQKKPEDPRKQQGGPGGSSGFRRRAGARVLGQQLLCRKWSIFPSP